MATDTALVGTVGYMEPGRSYAFLQVARERRSIFLHITDYGGEWPPEPGQRVAFTLSETQRGLRALEARPAA